MNAHISTKLTALAVALMMNSLLIAGVACLFNAQISPSSAALSLQHAALHGVA